MRSRLLARTRSHRTTIFRQIPSSRKVRKYFRERNRLAALETVYADSANLESIYDIWFNYCDSLTNAIDSWIVTADGDYKVFTKQHWPKIRKSYFAET
jgi:hypothetical protein